MVKENLKRKKRHDKDKYYHLAKEQGYRSRAAFKLIQINRKYDFLSRARVCIDLCAAPGGWCQVAAKHMPADSIVLGVDLLPIRPIPKVHTLVQDITTSECRALLKKEMKGHTADVVLCDGAPNVGGAYNKDAYVQNEIALAALRVATHHLGVGGTFLTKVYRSSDYNALIWVFNQLFQTVQAIKPSSSRQQSAEIFVLCLKYRAPRTIDPKLLDPQFVFQEIEDPNSTRGLTVLHEQFDKHNKRKRGGYEAGVGVLLLKRASVSSFIESEDPVRMLTDCNQLVFEEGCQPYLEHKLTTSEIKTCLDDLKVLGKGDFKSLVRWRVKMQAYRDSLVEALRAQEAAMAGETEGKEKDSVKEPARQTEEEEEEEVQGEILALQAAKAAKAKREKKKEREQRARLRLRQAYGMNQEGVDVSEGQETVFSLKDIKDAVALERIRRGDYADVPEGEDDDDYIGPEGGDEDDDDVEARNAALEAELEESYHQFLANKADERMKGTRAGKRKKAALAALASERTAEDMALYDGDLQEYAKLLAGKKDKDDDSDSSDDDDEEEEKDDEDDDAKESQGEDDADKFFGEDDEGDVSTDDNHDKGMAAKGGSRGRKGNPLVVDPSVFAAPDKAGVKVARWFSNPVFSALQAGLPEAGEKDDSREQQARKGKKAERRSDVEKPPVVDDDSDADMDDNGEKEDDGEEGLEDEGGDVGDAGDAEQAVTGRKAQQKHAKSKAVVKSSNSGGQTAARQLDPEIKGLAAEVLAAMPKTDKQIRHEKRMKARERKDRRASKRKRGVGSDDEDDAEVELVPGDGGSSMQLDDDGDDNKMLDPKEVEEQKKRREIIRAGMGKVLQQGDDGKGQGFEVVPEGYEGSSNKRAKIDELLPRADDRTYGTDDEMWDDEERAATLAIGTMMLRRSKAKELVDASYNRFAWNDPSELPEWFIDDEHKHYRPQIPIPKPLLDEMKEKFKTLASKPIAKVAEARARKKKRAMVELKKAKARATAITANPDMTEREKLKAIQKATKGRGSISKPGKVYAVVRGGGTSSVSNKKGKKGSEGGRSRVKLVDKRMKKDARGMAKVGKGGKRKGGKKAGKKGKR